VKDTVIVHGLGKQYRRYHQDRPWTLQEVFQRGFHRIRPAEYFWALRDVSFALVPGRMMGVIGGNGAGKSTLLRLIGGVGRPDEGTLSVRGRIDALLDLGAGFHPDLTGRENVFISGVINGLTRREVSQQFDSIVAFSELQEFIDSPLRTYSTGMQMRLAFAVATHTHPEVLLIDEVLAVGDLAFQHKCLQRIAQFKAEGCTIILVSHDAGLVAKMCDEALWLRAGRIMGHGRADEVARRYIAEAESPQGTQNRLAAAEVQT
jgi:lipopolysaccharide transport system ATP-binding protein